MPYASAKSWQELKLSVRPAMKRRAICEHDSPASVARMPFIECAPLSPFAPRPGGHIRWATRKAHTLQCTLLGSGFQLLPASGRSGGNMVWISPRAKRTVSVRAASKLFSRTRRSEIFELRRIAGSVERLGIPYLNDAVCNQDIQMLASVSRR